MMTPQYGHSFVGGFGGNAEILSTMIDGDRGTSAAGSADDSLTTVSFVTSTGGGLAGPDVSFMVARSGSTPGALSSVLAGSATVGVVCGFATLKSIRLGWRR